MLRALRVSIPGSAPAACTYVFAISPLASSSAVEIAICPITSAFNARDEPREARWVPVCFSTSTKLVRAACLAGANPNAIETTTAVIAEYRNTRPSGRTSTT